MLNNNAISVTIESDEAASRKAALEQKVVNYDEVVAENIRLRQCSTIRAIIRILHDFVAGTITRIRHMDKYVHYR